MIRVDPSAVRRGLFVVIGALSVANLANLFVRSSFDSDRLDRIARLFDVNLENNVPAYYSGIALLAAAASLLAIGMLHRRASEPGTGWFGLAAVFAFLAYDEVFKVHERFGPLVRDWFDTSGPLYFGWYVVYVPVGLVLAAVYAPFVFGLPAATRKRFILAGALFVAGAVGFEVLGSAEFEARGTGSPLGAVLYSIEEFLEMLGVALFISAMLDYVASRFRPDQFSQSRSNDDEISLGALTGADDAT